MDALARMIALEKEARQFGFDWPHPQMILDQAVDECREIREEIEQGSDKKKLQEEIGDLLHAAVSLCVFCGFKVEETLDKTNTKFAGRLGLLKQLASSHGLADLQGQTLDFMLKLWKQVKQMEKEAPLATL